MKTANTTNTTEKNAKVASKLEEAKKDLLSLEKSYLSDVKKYISNDLKNASNHIEALKSIIKELHFNRVTSNGIALIKEEYLKAYKTDANQTFKKFSMRYGWLLIASVQETIKSETNIALIDSLNQTDLENYIKPVVTRGGGRVASDKEDTIDTPSTPSEPIDTPSTPSEPIDTPSTPSEPIDTKELSNGILEAISSLLTLDSDSILFKISKLSNEDLKSLNVALRLLA